MSDNKENSEINTSEKKKQAPLKLAPLWIRISAFIFALLTAGVLFYDMSLEDNMQGKTCAEKEREFLILQDRVAQLEQKIKIGDYIKRDQNPQLSKDLEIIFDKIDNIENELHSSAKGVIGEIRGNVLGNDTLEKVDSLVSEFSSLKNSVEDLFVEKDKINENIKYIAENQDNELKAFFAFEKLKTTVLSQSPYKKELDTLKSLFGGYEPNKWESLERNETTGIPSVKSLTQQLRKYIKTAITTADENSDWWDKTKVNMSKVVTVRKQGFVEGDDVDEILARAEYSLVNNQNLEGLMAALDEISTLPQDKINIFSDWINEANTVIEIQQSLDEIRRNILVK